MKSLCCIDVRTFSTSPACAVHHAFSMTLDRAVPMRECWGWHGERSPSEIVEAQARIAVTAALSDVIDTDDILSVKLSNDTTVTVTFKAQEIVSVADVQRAQ